jgi:hypothetical protein
MFDLETYTNPLCYTKDDYELLTEEELTHMKNL